MKNTKLYLYAASLIACSSTAFTAGAAEATNPAESPLRPPYREWTVGADAGSAGLGVCHGASSGVDAGHGVSWGLVPPTVRETKR